MVALQSLLMLSLWLAASSGADEKRCEDGYSMFDGKGLSQSSAGKSNSIGTRTNINSTEDCCST